MSFKGLFSRLVHHFGFFFSFMKTSWLRGSAVRGNARGVSALLFWATLCLALPAGAQNTFIAHDRPVGALGNCVVSNGDWGVGNTFYVIKPITVLQLGVFDDGSDGIKGQRVLTVQLYSRNGCTWEAGRMCRTVWRRQ